MFLGIQTAKEDSNFIAKIISRSIDIPVGQIAWPSNSPELTSREFSLVKFTGNGSAEFQEL